MDNAPKRLKSLDESRQESPAGTEAASDESAEPSSGIWNHLDYAHSNGVHVQATQPAYPPVTDNPQCESSMQGFQHMCTPWTTVTEYQPLYSEEDIYSTYNSRLDPSQRPKLTPLGKNPFIDNSKDRLPKNFPTNVVLPTDSEVDSYIKLRIKDSQRHRLAQDEKYQFHKPHKLYNTKKLAAPSQNSPTSSKPQIVSVPTVPRMPNHFDRPFEGNKIERELMRFYVVCFCSGRSLLPQTNSWHRDLAPMVKHSKLVRDTVLALAATYMFEYSSSENLRLLSNKYYYDAVQELDKDLQGEIPGSQRQVDEYQNFDGQINAIIGAIALFNMHDVVTWEVRRPKDHLPRWLEGAHLASSLLDKYDSSYRYRKSRNVQRDSTQLSSAIMTARAAIFALPLTPLETSKTDGRYHWLLHGDNRDNLRIHGTSGLSPLLLHMWSQATHICARFQINQESPIYPVAVQNLLGGLDKFQQWSELAEGHDSLDDLLYVFDTDFNDKDKAARLTELGGAAWVFALKIYMLCRFYRYPRNHPQVLESMDSLAECVKRMPTKGQLFTAQIPLLAIFLLGLLSVKQYHRDIARRWFEGVVSVIVCRSSVIPLWPALKGIWNWIDDVAILGDENAHFNNVSARHPWWEDMVAKIMETEGTLCLI